MNLARIDFGFSTHLVHSASKRKVLNHVRVQAPVAQPAMARCRQSQGSEQAYPTFPHPAGSPDVGVGAPQSTTTARCTRVSPSPAATDIRAMHSRATRTRLHR